VGHQHIVFSFPNYSLSPAGTLAAIAVHRRASRFASLRRPRLLASAARYLHAEPLHRPAAAAPRSSVAPGTGAATRAARPDPEADRPSSRTDPRLQPLATPWARKPSRQTPRHGDTPQEPTLRRSFFIASKETLLLSFPSPLLLLASRFSILHK
jgi:hypothetical protein